MLKIVHNDRRVTVWDDSEDNWSSDPGEETINQINEWVRANELGYRDSYNGWKLRNSAAVTVFLLRWQPV